MLQIISGKFFKSDDRHVFDRRGITYGNYSWDRPIVTCVATLEPVDTYGAVSSHVISYKNQIEKDGLLVRTGDTDIIEQFLLLCVFGLRAFFDQDRDVVAVNCRQTPLSASDRHLPSVFVPRFFSPHIQGTLQEEQDFISLVSKVIGLPRDSYKAIVTSLSSFVQALQAVSHSIDLAYSLIVYSLEALSQGFDAFFPTWDDYPDQSRARLNKLLSRLDLGMAEDIRSVLLSESHLRLRKRFIEFVCRHIESRFFTDEAPEGYWAIPRSLLERGLSNAYDMRSKFVHRLQPIQEQMRAPNLAPGDFLFWENEPYLTFAGLVRVAHHAIRNFIQRQEYLPTEDINWRDELPGILRVKMAPQYWMWRHEGFTPSHAHQKLSGFLTQFDSIMPHGGSLTGLRDLMAKYEQVLPSARKEERKSMFALYYLYNRFIESKGRVPGYEKVFERHQKEFDECSIQAMVVSLLIGCSKDWPAAQCSDAWRSYAKNRYKDAALRLPPLLEIAVMLAIGYAYRSEGDEGAFRNWYDDAVLEAAGRPALQAAIVESTQKQVLLTYEAVLHIAKPRVDKVEQESTSISLSKTPPFRRRPQRTATSRRIAGDTRRRSVRPRSSQRCSGTVARRYTGRRSRTRTSRPTCDH